MEGHTFNPDGSSVHSKTKPVCYQRAGSSVNGKGDAQLHTFTVEGHTFNPEGGRVQGLEKLTSNLEAIAEVFAICNEARIESRVRLSASLSDGLTSVKLTPNSEAIAEAKPG